MAGVVASTLAFTQIAVRGEQRPALEIVREVNPKTCQISFTILDPRDEPIAGATVQLINSQANYSTHTDSKGLAVFDRVEAGRYKITAAAQGFHAYTMSEMSIERPIEPNIRVVLTVGTFVGVVDISDSDLPLFQSIRQGNSESIINAIKGGFGVNTLDSRRRTALHYAAEVGNLELVRFLVNKGADVNAKDKEKLSPIVLIGGDDEDESRDILQILLDHGADVNATDEDGDTLLMRACDDDNVDVVKVLLGHRAKVNLKNPDGETALDKTTSEEVRQLLIGAGAKSDKATNQKPRRI
jgi:ankyrin repeat protein